MFKSVLGILLRTYAPAVTSTSTPEIQNKNAGMSSSRCPVLNGSIQKTDYWRALERNAPTCTSHKNMSSGGDSEGQRGDGNGNGNGLGGLHIDELVNHPQDWPSVFEEWVVDLNALPE